MYVCINKCINVYNIKVQECVSKYSRGYIIFELDMKV